MISVISIITAEYQAPLSSLPLLEASLIFASREIIVQDRACTHITSTVEHTHYIVFEDRNGGTQTV